MKIYLLCKISSGGIGKVESFVYLEDESNVRGGYIVKSSLIMQVC